MLRLTILAGCLAAVVFVLVICGGGSSSPTLEPNPTALPTATDVPSGTRTGIPEIDTMLDGVFSGDEEAVRDLIGYTPTACAIDPQGLGSPPQCLGEETEGTFIDMFAVGYCHGVYVRPEDMGGVIATLSRPGARLRAVSPANDLWPSGDHVVVYDQVRGPEEPFDPDIILGGTDRPPHSALILVLRDGAIVGILDACQGTPEEFLNDRKLDPILFNPPDGLTGIGGVDSVAPVE